MDQRGHDLPPQRETLWALSPRWGCVNTVYLMRHCAGDTLPRFCLAESLFQYSQIIGRLMSQSSESGQRVPKSSEREALATGFKSFESSCRVLLFGHASVYLSWLRVKPTIAISDLESKGYELKRGAEFLTVLLKDPPVFVCLISSSFPLVQQLQSINNNNTIFFCLGLNI